MVSLLLRGAFSKMIGDRFGAMTLLSKWLIDDDDDDDDDNDDNVDDDDVREVECDEDDGDDVAINTIS